MNQSQISQIVDQLGELRAQIAALQDAYDTGAALLKEQGAGAYIGNNFDATVSVSERTTVAWKSVAEKLNPSRQLIAAHSTDSTVVAVKVTARVVGRIAKAA